MVQRSTKTIITEVKSCVSLFKQFLLTPGQQQRPLPNPAHPSFLLCFPQDDCDYNWLTQDDDNMLHDLWYDTSWKQEFKGIQKKYLLQCGQITNIFWFVCVFTPGILFLHTSVFIEQHKNATTEPMYPWKRPFQRGSTFKTT